MIKKRDAYKIKHQPNVEMFVWGCNDFIESKLKEKLWWPIKNQQNIEGWIWKKRKKHSLERRKIGR
jgi:hypothetical protein